MRSIVISVLFVSLAFCGTTIQTDWSGGPGVQGPISNWGDTFWSSDVNTDYNAGKLQLLLVPIEHTVDGNFNGARSVYSTDVDGDGDADILGAGANCDDITWWENTDGTGTAWTEHTVDGDFEGAWSVFAADVDGDGDADVLGAANYDEDITWWENTDGTGTIWTEHIVDSDFNSAVSVFAADVDGDGDADVLGAANYDDNITWWENTDGTGTVWTEHLVDGDFVGAHSVIASDIDGDGDTDVLGAAAGADDITWWENMDGSGELWTKHLVDGDFHGAYYVYSTDIDGDGDADILGVTIIEDEITWWENTDGTGITWAEHIISGDFDGAMSVYSTDVDGDGDADVLGAAGAADDIIWWENTDGTGTNWSEHIVDGDFNAAASVYSTDIDGDGDADILGAAPLDDDITWWDVMYDPPSGSLESSILDTGDVGEWNIFLSSSQIPAGTSISFQFRSSDDSFNMGAWSDTVFSLNTPLSGILADSTRFLQYKVILDTSDPRVSPELAEVAFSYTLQVGVGESESDEVPSWSFYTLENPSHGFFSALVSVPETGLVNLSLYDVSGRVIEEVSQELSIGTHSVNFTGLAEGVYFCVVTAGEFSATERIVVLE